MEWEIFKDSIMLDIPGVIIGYIIVFMVAIINVIAMVMTWVFKVITSVEHFHAVK